MPVKFRRNYRLLTNTNNSDIGSASSFGSPQYFNRAQSVSYSKTGSVEIAPPFTVEFNVVRQNLASVNTAQFTVYNLGETTRNFLRKDEWQTDVYRPIEFWGGYGTGLPPTIEAITSPNISLQPNQILPLLFKGNVTTAYSYRQGVDFLTKFECQDGGFMLMNNDVTVSYGPGTPIRQIIGYLIDSMKPTISLGAIGGFNGVLQGWFKEAGNPKDILEKLVAGRFYIDGEKAYCFENSEYLGLSTVPLLNDNSGILGVPVLSRQYVSVELLFEPNLVVNQRIQLASTVTGDLNGLYTIKGLTHKGMISQSVCGSATTSLILQRGTSADIPVAAA